MEENDIENDIEFDQQVKQSEKINVLFVYDDVFRYDRDKFHISAESIIFGGTTLGTVVGMSLAAVLECLGSNFLASLSTGGIVGLGFGLCFAGMAIIYFSSKLTNYIKQYLEYKNRYKEAGGVVIGEFSIDKDGNKYINGVKLYKSQQNNGKKSTKGAIVVQKKYEKQAKQWLKNYVKNLNYSTKNSPEKFNIYNLCNSGVGLSNSVQKANERLGELKKSK